MATNERRTGKTPAISDVPRAGFSCGSYQDGHNVHYAAVAKSAPGKMPVPARIACREGSITLMLGEESTAVYSHNSAAIDLIIRQVGSVCSWFPGLSLVCWTTKTERHWASLSLEPVSECFSAEQAHLAEIEWWS